MYTSTSAPTAALRMPLQAPGVGRGTARTSALAVGGVEAAGIGSWLFGGDFGDWFDSVGNVLLGEVPFGDTISQMLSPFIP